jgi:hypothetical protein
VARHAECGAAITELPVCAEHGVVAVEEVEIVPGPGFITSGRS